MAEGLFRLRYETACIVCRSQGIGAYRTYVPGIQLAQTLTEAMQAGQRPLLRLDGKQLPCIEPVSQPYHFPMTVDNAQLPVLEASNNHLKAVGAEINSRDNPGI